MLENSLKELGFTEKEISVYLAVLENGKISPARIALLTNIKRPTVYSVGKELIKKGLITEDLDMHGGYFVSLPPENITSLLKKQEQDLLKKKKSAEIVISELKNIPQSKAYSVPRMRFIEEYNIKDFLYKQTPVWENSLKISGDTTWWGFQDHTFVESKDFHEWIEWYWSRAPQEFNLKLFSNESVIEEKMKEKHIDRRIIKFWGKDTKFTATYWILGEYVVFIMSKQRPYYLVEIHDAIYAENIREVFRNLWEVKMREGENPFTPLETVK